MGTSLLTLDSLENFLREHNLGLRSRAKILGDGNCWWRSVADLIKLYGLNALIDPGLLRKMVVASLKTHPRKMDWAMAAYNGKVRDYNAFVKNQASEGTWTDEEGIVVFATADYLGVDIHIAGDQNCNKNSRDPILVVQGSENDGEDDKAVLHIGYYQANIFFSLSRLLCV